MGEERILPPSVATNTTLGGSATRPIERPSWPAPPWYCAGSGSSAPAGAAGFFSTGFLPGGAASADVARKSGSASREVVRMAETYTTLRALGSAFDERGGGRAR